MKKTILSILISVFALVAVGIAKGPAFGEEGRRHGKESIGIPVGKWWKRPQIAEKIGITDNEKEKLDVMFYKHRYQMIDLHSRVQKERLELEKLLDRKDFDAKASIDQFANLQKANNTRAAERFGFLVQVRELLGLDRFQRLKEQVRKYRKQWRREKRRLTK